MTPHTGVLTTAFGDWKYVQQAINLARSIRLRDPQLPLAVATPYPSSAFEGLYDPVIPWPVAEWPEQKFELYALAPFDTTLFLDADCLVVQSLARVFEYFGDREFAVFGTNIADAKRWWRSVDIVRATVPASTFPMLNGGLYYFKKSALAKEIFDRAQRLADDYDALSLFRMGDGHQNDEPLVSLAMAQAGLAATDDPSLDVMYPVEDSISPIHINVLAGECRFVWHDGRVVTPVIAHFVGHGVRRYEYRREALRLEVTSRGSSFPQMAMAIRSSKLALDWLKLRVARG